jgi:hypothetical protein
MLALGTVAVEPERAEDGSWLDPGVLAKLKALRGPAAQTKAPTLRTPRPWARGRPARSSRQARRLDAATVTTAVVRQGARTMGMG